MSVPLRKTTSRDEAIGLLAPALGDDKAASTVDAAASALGLSSEEWTSAQFRAVFAHISTESGLVGITARVVSRRLKHGGDALSATSGAHPAAGANAMRGAVDGAPKSAARPVEASQKPIEAIADLMKHALGAESAMQEVARAARLLGYGDNVHFSEALKVLEHLAREPGLVGIAAQFAKTRLHLLTW